VRPWPVGRRVARRRRIVGVVSVSLAALAAHTGAVPIATAGAERSGMTAAAGGELSGTRWKAKRIAGLPLPPGYVANLRFGQRTARGRHGCNRYRAHYDVGPKSRLRFRGLATTLVGCGGIEDPPDFLRALTRTRMYRRGHGRLVLLDVDGRALARLVRRR
jgi:heat shock protein HslJ